MKIIDLSITNAFRRMKAVFKTNAEISRRVDLSQIHVARILNGKTQYFSDETWARIEPVLRAYLRSDDQDYIRDRISSIYASLDRADQAELLAAAERIKSKAGPEGPEQPEPPRPETVAVEPRRHDGTKDPNEISVDIEKAVAGLDQGGEKTKTPRGNTDGTTVFHHEIRCPQCQSLFFVPKIRIRNKMACPFCGQHITIM